MYNLEVTCYGHKASNAFIHSLIPWIFIEHLQCTWYEDTAMNKSDKILLLWSFHSILETGKQRDV